MSAEFSIAKAEAILNGEVDENTSTPPKAVLKDPRGGGTDRC